MKAIFNFFNRFAGWKTLLLSIGVYIFFSAYILKNAETKINQLAGQSVGVIDLTFGFDIQRTLNMIANYGQLGRDYYFIVTLTIDTIFPLVYTFLFSTILIMLYRERSAMWLVKLPLINMALDFAENITIVTLLKSYPLQSSQIAFLCESFKALKWLSLGAILILIIYGLLLRALKLLVKRV